MSDGATPAKPLGRFASHRHSVGVPPSRPRYTLFILILTLMFAQLDLSIVPYLASSMKRDLALSDTALSLLLGLSFSLFYTVVGLPMAWAVDCFSRKWILALGIGTWSLGTALCGISQSAAQLFGARFLVGAGEAVNAPASFSLLGDVTSRERMPRGVALMQIGSVSGPVVAMFISAVLLSRFLHMPPIQTPVGLIRGWQLIFLLCGLPGIAVSVLILASLPEPARRITPDQGEGRGTLRPGPLAAITEYRQIFRYMWQRRSIFGPIFGSLLVSSLVLGTQQWTPIFYERTYGWAPARLAALQGFASLTLMPLGMVAGVATAERFARAGRDDAAMRANLLGRLIAVPGVLATLMPNGWLAFAFSGLTMFGVGFSTPSMTAALQIVAPADMRGRITALFLFVLNVVGSGLAPILVAALSDLVFGEAQIRWSIFLPTVILMPLTVAWASAGVGPYGREVARLRGLERKAEAGNEG